MSTCTQRIKLWAEDRMGQCPRPAGHGPGAKFCRHHAKRMADEADEREAERLAATLTPAQCRILNAGGAVHVA